MVHLFVWFSSVICKYLASLASLKTLAASNKSLKKRFRTLKPGTLLSYTLGHWLIEVPRERAVVLKG